MREALNRFLDDMGAYETARECLRFADDSERERRLASEAHAVHRSLDLLLAHKYSEQPPVMLRGRSFDR